MMILVDAGKFETEFSSLSKKKIKVSPTPPDNSGDQIKSLFSEIRQSKRNGLKAFYKKMGFANEVTGVSSSQNKKINFDLMTEKLNIKAILKTNALLG